MTAVNIAQDALTGLLDADASLAGLDRAEALERDDLSFLAGFALSDAYLELRATAERAP